ncbi:MAG: 3'(2'),5'-bisphosphate nucleotidase CysQ [Hyphomonadaceae bacterium]|nr:3'(2'),5'-bisphosphate nucleotidase CysQ [Hyphomonadaceae bacterium]
MQSAASDLELIEAAARDAGALARKLFAKPLEIKSKGEAGPVTNVDFAVNDLLQARLCEARPDYGWLSEESPDGPERLNKSRVFIIDPIDGTAAMIAKSPQFTISIGVSDEGRAFAGAIYNPLTDEMFAGAPGVRATLNGRPIKASARSKLDGMRMVGLRHRFGRSKWPEAWPPMEIIERQSIAYRMALVGADMADATLLFGWKNEWDIAGGAAIVEAAGGRVSDPWGAPLRLNNPSPRTPGGVVAAGAALHPLLIERTKHFPDPREG